MVQALYDTELLLKSICKRKTNQWSIDTSANFIGAARWDRAVEAAHRVINYIQNYLCHEGSMCLTLYGLSAIGAAQEALGSALALCRDRSNENLHIQLYNEHTLRAKLIVNGVVAVSMRDHELASLWVLASEEVRRRSELKCVGNTNDTSIPNTILDLARRYLTSATSATNDSQDAEEKNLLQLASRHFRLAAVWSLLGRTHAHHVAAETYQQAAVLSRSSVTDGTPMTLNLWQTAVSSMRLAGDMIAVHTDESSANNDPLITQTIATAKQLVEDARRVPTLVASVDKWKSKAESVMSAAKACKNSFLLPVLQLLLTMLQSALRTSEKYLDEVSNCNSRSTSSVELERSLSWRESEITGMEIAVQKLEELIRNAHNYRTRASQVSSTTKYKHLCRILRECWTKAADQAEHILQLTTDLVKDGLVQTLAHDLSGEWQRRYDVVRSYVYVAENVVTVIVEYLDKARGAEVGEKNGRDPREALMWYKASEFLLTKAECMSSVLRYGRNVSAAGVSVPDFLLSSAQPAQKAEYCARAGDLLYRADKYKQLDHAHQHALQISSVYEKLATLTIRKYTLDTDTVTFDSTRGAILFEDSVLSFMFKFIELLNASAPITSELMSVYERGCEYGYTYLLSIYASKDCAASWKSAFEYCFNARNVLQSVQNSDSAERVAYELAMASVFALGAAAAEQGRKCFSLACTHAARVIKTLFRDVPFRVYRVALAERILVFADKSDPGSALLVIPAELHQLMVVEVRADPAYEILLNKHAEAFCLDAECEHQAFLSSVDKSVARAWTDAKREVLNLISHLELRAKHYFNLAVPADHDANLYLFYKLLVPCYMAAAKHQSGSAVSVAWNKAIAMSRMVTVRHLDTSTVAIERYARAARAYEIGDIKLSALWEKAAIAARLWHERTVSPHFGLEAARCEFKQADCIALGFQAQREGNIKLVDLWKNTSVKWKEAAAQSPLKVVDMKKQKDALQQGVIMGLIAEAERLEETAVMAARLPQEDTKPLSQDSVAEVDDVSSTPSVTPIATPIVAVQEAQRNGNLPAAPATRPGSHTAKTSVELLLQKTPAVVPAVASGVNSSSSALSSHRSSSASAQQIPPHRTGLSSTDGLPIVTMSRAGARGSVGANAGAGLNAGVAVSAPSRPQSARSTVSTSSRNATMKVSSTRK